MKKYAGKIMRWTLVSLLALCLTIICILPCRNTEAALTMTTSIDEIDAWASITAGTMREGTADSISDSYSSVLYIEVAMIEAVAHDGVEVIVEVSYGDDDWTKLSEFKGTAETCATTQTAEDPMSAGDTTATLDDSATGDFDVVGRKWFIKDATIGNSESVRTLSDNANVVTLCQDTMREHAVDSNCYDRVDEWVVHIPFGAAYVRVLVNNVDADCDVASTTRISKVTALN